MPSIINATTTNGVAISPDNSGSLQLATNNGTTAVTIDTSQNVGIGTSSPTGKLDVVSGSSLVGRFYNNAGRGIVRVDGSADSSFQAYRNGSLIGWFQTDGSGTEINTGTVGAHPFIFYTNNTERMRIDSSGNAMIGTTTSGGRLTVSTATGSYVTRFITEGNNQDYIAFVSGTNIVGSVSRVGGTNVAYNTSSDYRLKENITPMTGALAKVQQLKPCNWTWKLDGSDGQGFIAHELKEVCPDAVHGEKDAVDEEGNPVYQGVDTSFLVATLTAAIQELKAELDTVKAELNTLKNPPVEGTE